MKSLISFIIRYIPRKYLQLVSHNLLKILRIFYRGSNVACNICGSTFRKFLPYGRKARENALCPTCLGLERHRLMWLYLKERTNFFEDNLSVLHIAPEICFINKMENLDNLNYITGDIESPLAKVKMDVHQIPFSENSFDVVLCNHVMEHVDDDIQACKEINRVLKPTGWGIIQSPVYDFEETLEDSSIIDPQQRERIFGQRDHVRKYGKDYARRLSQSGLRVEEDLFVKQVDPKLIEKHALPPNEVIFFCRKGVGINP